MKAFAIVLRDVALTATLLASAPAAHAQASGAGEIREKDIPIQVTEVAPGLYFQYHHQESNVTSGSTSLTSPGSYWRCLK